MPNIKKVSDEVIAESYNRLGNVWKVGAEVGICGQNVHERVTKLGIVKKMNLFTKEEDEELKEIYEQYASVGRLQDLADKFGRTKNFLCRQAKRLGLTSLKRKKSDFIGVSDKMSKSQKERYKKHQHPRSMLGKKHSEETKKLLSETSKRIHQKLKEDGRVSEIKQRMVKTRYERYGASINNRFAVSWKSGWRIVGGINIFFRSRWEYNYAIYIQHIFEKGEIKSWEHEPEPFWFKITQQGLPLSYKPDFKVINNDDSICYHEVKGWMCDRSKAIFKIMAEQFPEVKIILIQKQWFKDNIHLKDQLEGWEK